MSKILELRNKRVTLWEQTKAFLEQHRGENGLVSADAIEQYNRMPRRCRTSARRSSVWSVRLRSMQRWLPHLLFPST